MSSWLGTLAQYASDTFRIVQSPFSWKRRMRLWIGLTSLAAGFRSGTVLGYKINCYSGQALSFLYREIFARQCYLFEANTSRPLILDCGANIGMAVLYFKWLYPDSEVWAFEPEPTSFAALQENVVQNHLANVSMHNVALWDADGHLDLFVPGNSQGSLVTSAIPARTRGIPVNVRCARLSSFIEREVDLLKIDVEGAELQVLRDLAESGKIGLIRQMVIEYHHNIPSEPAAMSRLLRVLEDSGFRYQIAAGSLRLTTHDQFQDILIGAFRVPTES